MEIPDEMDFLATHPGPQLAANDIDTRIWTLDRTYNLWGRAIAELDDPREPELRLPADSVSTLTWGA